MWPENPFMFGGWGSPSVPGYGGGMIIQLGGSGGAGGLLSRARRPRQPPGMAAQQIQGLPTLDASSLTPSLPMSRRGGPQQMQPLGAQPIDMPNVQDFQNQPLPQFTQPKQGWGSQLYQGVYDNRMPLLQLGAGLLDVAEGAGTWSDAARGFQGAREAQDAKALQQEELDYVRGERSRMGDERQRAKAEYDRIIADPNVPPDVKAAVRAAGPSGLADIMNSQVVTAAQKAEIEGRNAALAQDESQFTRDQQFRAEQGSLDRAAQNRGLGLEFGMGRYFQSQDAEFLGDQTALSAQIQSVGLPSLLNVQQTIGEARKIGGVAGQPIGANDRVTLGRLFNGSGPGRPTLEVWRAQVLTPALESMRGLGAMTEKEFEAAMSSFANPNMTLEAAETLIKQKVAEARRRIATANITQQFAREANGITGVNNKAGQNYGTYLAQELERQGLGGAVPPSNAPPAPSQQQGPRDLAGVIDNVLSAGGRASGGGQRIQTPQNWTPQRMAAIPPRDRSQLYRMQGDPQARAAFDQQYGQGASDYVLTRMGVRRRTQ
jgi:hypothetical protein